MRISVIVVDDDLDNLEVLSEYLELRELDVLAKARDGHQAYELYKKLRPNIVLLDVVMSGYDGFYAFEKIRKFDKDAKVIFVTAAISGITQKRLFETDVNGILFKPFEMEKLIEAIATVQKGGRSIPSTVRSKYS